MAMKLSTPEQRIYARDEVIADGVVHATAIAATIIAGVYLLIQNLDVDGGRFAGLLIYLVGLLTMLGCSAAYNLTPVSPLKWFLRRFDHSAIYVMIAGTYTPLLLLLPNASLALGLALIVWLGAAVGVALKLCWPGRHDGLAVVAYLALGWVGVFAASSFMAVLPRATMALIFAGGMLYTAGVPFYLWESLKFQNAIWHVFVVAAAAAHFVAIALLYP
jgi:hemolysin III